MAKDVGASEGKEPDSVASGDKGALSTPMRELILSFEAEERRKGVPGEENGGSDPGKRRRRTDPTKPPEQI